MLIKSHHISWKNQVKQMKLRDLFKQDKQNISFEVFPPKTSTSFDNVMAAAKDIASLHPAFVSVTYGAGGGTSAYTLDIAKGLSETANVPTLAHLTCVSSDRETIHERIKAMQDAGIENVLALRGDLTPELEASDRNAWEYRHATDLMHDIKSSGVDFCMGGACYPEKHPESLNQAEDIARLKDKQDAGCEFLTTQMFFDNNLFYSFLYKAREAGVTIPILPGIMPITRAEQLERAIKLSGSFMPQRFKSLVDHFGKNPEAMKQAGIAYATDQIIDLFANGIKIVHVYSMNKPDVAAKISENLSEIIG